jgi:hypothetical protein
MGHTEKEMNALITFWTATHTETRHLMRIEPIQPGSPPMQLVAVTWEDFEAVLSRPHGALLDDGEYLAAMVDIRFPSHIDDDFEDHFLALYIIGDEEVEATCAESAVSSGPIRPGIFPIRDMRIDRMIAECSMREYPNAR